MTIHQGDCIEVMAGMPADSVDAVVKERSRTLQGIADAMANQWGSLGRMAAVDQLPLGLEAA